MKSIDKKQEKNNRNEHVEHFLLKTLAKWHQLATLLLRRIDWDFAAGIRSMSAEKDSLLLPTLPEIFQRISVNHLPINGATITF